MAERREPQPNTYDDPAVAQLAAEAMRGELAIRDRDREPLNREQLEAAVRIIESYRGKDRHKDLKPDDPKYAGYMDGYDAAMGALRFESGSLPTRESIIKQKIEDVEARAETEALTSEQLEMLVGVTREQYDAMPDGEKQKIAWRVQNQTKPRPLEYEATPAPVRRTI